MAQLVVPRSMPMLNLGRDIYARRLQSYLIRRFRRFSQIVIRVEDKALVLKAPCTKID